jgi:hypothetical protein
MKDVAGTAALTAHESLSARLPAPVASSAHTPRTAGSSGTPATIPDRPQAPDQRNAEIGAEADDIEYGKDDHRAYHHPAQPPDVLCLQTLKFYTFVDPLIDGIDA